jgi:hypothetical protein
MDRPVLNDPAVFPSDEVLAGHLGQAYRAWPAFLELLKSSFPAASFEWRYYNDGKSWLGKVTQKSKTLCWVAVWDRVFSCAFYLNDKAEPLVRAASLGEAMKEAFFSSAGKTKFRHIRVEVKKKGDLAAVKEMLEIKLKLK